MDTPYISSVDSHKNNPQNAAIQIIPQEKQVQPNDGLLLRENDNGRKKGAGATAIKCIAIAVLLSILIHQYALHRRSVWEAAMWKSCGSASFKSNTAAQQLPCSKRNNNWNNARCTYSYDTLHVWCGDGHYYFSENNDGSYTDGWIMIGVDGSMSAIWEESHDCNELGMYGWDQTCIDHGMDEDELEDNDSVSCVLNQWMGFLSCGGMNFDYDEDGVFTLTSYDDDQYDAPDNYNGRARRRL